MSGPSVKMPADWLDSDPIEDLDGNVVMLMITALGYSARQASNGIVPRRRMRKLWPTDDLEKSIELLVAAGELEDNGDQVFFVNWRDFILEADEIDRIKSQSRERTERSRRHKSGDHSMCRPAYCREASRLRDESRDTVRDGNGTARVSDADPYRPDPYRPLGRGGKGRAAPAGGSARATQPAHATPPARGATPWDYGVTPTITVLKPARS